VVARLQGEEAARRAADHFRRVVQRKQTPDEIPEHRLELEGRSELGLLEVLQKIGMIEARNEGRRLVTQGAVHLDDRRVEDPTCRLRPGSYLVRVGIRRFARLELIA